MSDHILKFPLSITEEQTISIPGFVREWLSIQVQNGTPTIWAVVGEGKGTKEEIILFGTGWDFDRTGVGQFLGTVQTGGMVFHYFVGRRT